MKRLLATAVLTALTMLQAAPVGNPSFPELIDDGFFIPSSSWIDLRLGYEGDFVGDGQLKQYLEGHGRIDHFKQDTNSATATVNLFNRVDLYGVFGSTRISSRWRFIESGTTNLTSTETNYQFLWGAGARGILYEWGNATIGIGGRYSQTRLQPLFMLINGIAFPASGAHLKWAEWQVDLDISYKIDIFVPYVGVKYSNVRAKIGPFPYAIAAGGGTLHMKNRTPAGLVIGCTLTTGKYFMFNVEGRLIDEEALTVAGDFRF